MYFDAKSYSMTRLWFPSRPKAPVKNVVHLSDCLSVTIASKEPCPAGCSSFYINTIKCTYILASSTSQDWLRALSHLAFQKYPGKSDTGYFEEERNLIMEDNHFYSPWKSLVSPETSQRCKLFSDYLMTTDQEAVLLLNTDTGHLLIHLWPYRSLLKYTQDEGGFSFEAGQYCDCGGGVFSFITPSAPQIFQSISRHCSVEVKPLVQPLSTDKGSSKPISSITHHGDAIQHPPVPTNDTPANVADTAEESTCYYSTISDSSVQLCADKPHCSGSNKATEEIEDGDVEELCYSLEAADLENMEDCIYYNLRGAAFPLFNKDQFPPDLDNSVYLFKCKDCPPYNPLLQTSPSPLVQHLLPPFGHSESAAGDSTNPQNLHLAPVVKYTQPYYAQAKARDGVKKTEKAAHSPACVPSQEDPDSFKHRLALIISKDLAKFQTPHLHRSTIFFHWMRKLRKGREGFLALVYCHEE